MDPIDSGQGENKPSGQDWDLTPSSKGRQRKRNPKYFDYDTAEKAVVQKTPRRSTRGARKTPEKPPAKVEEAENVTQEAADGGKETTDQTPQESDGKTSEETPKKTPRARKTPAKRTPAKKTPAKRTPGRKTPAKRTPKANGTLPGGEGGVDIGGVGEAGVEKDGVGEAGVGEGGVGEGAVVDGVQQENGAPKPKRKYVRRQQKAAPVTDPPCAEPEEVIEPGGRRRRAAAKAALKYLENLAKEVLHHPSDESGAKPGANSEGSTSPVKEKNTPKGGKGRRSRKRKRGFDSDAEDDEDFVPAAEEYEAEEVEEEEEEEEEGDSDLDLNFRTSTGSAARNQSALAVNINRGVWDTIEVTKKFREEHYSSWVFPEWVPTTSSWNLVPPSNVEKYLPQELRSAAFKVSREGLKKEETPLQRLSRFEAVPPHPERWDMLLYTGGPVWAMEWCPTPEGAPATQYIAVACHRGMDDKHRANKLYSGPGLVQLWDVGKLEYNTSPDSRPVLAYGLAQDKGFIWHLKWCPAGGWELPSCGRKAPFLPRLGLLAVVTSTGVVTIYSLPHPDALHANKNLPDSGKADQQLPIYQAKGVVTLKLGSFRAPREEQSGQVLSLDWLPEKPHNVMAVGFYDGVVGLWDLSTKSALLRVRESDGSLSLMPYRSFLAHNHCVRALTFCPASRYLLVTAGEDRHIKTWDLRRLDGPIIFLKRYVTNEIYWSLNTPGVLMAQETSYVAKGTHGVHFFDYNMNSLFMIPLTSTLWSISYTDWLNIVATSDDLGEVIIGLLPHKTSLSPYLKRTVERRFPIYLSSMEPHDGGEKENEVVGGAEEGEEERGEAAEEQEGGGGGGGEVEEREAGSEGGNENRGRGRGGRTKYPPLPFQTYKEAAKKYCLHLEDFDLRSVTGIEKRALWKRMRDMEVKTKLNLDEMPLASLHKVRFSPNMSSHTWVVSAGQTGLVRLNCLRSMFSPHVKDIIKKNQAQFNALYSPKPPQPQPQPEAEAEVEVEAEAVHTDANQL